MKFKKLKIKEYKIFKNVDLKFNDKLTLITGGNGSGKSTLFNLMKDICNKKEVNSCVLEIEGKMNVKDLDYVFINNLGVFEKNTTLTISEKIILNLIHIIQWKEELKIETPLVLDCPFSRLNKTQIKVILNLLKNLDQQIIIFQTKCVSLGIKSDYTIVQNSNFNESRLLKNEE